MLLTMIECALRINLLFAHEIVTRVRMGILLLEHRIIPPCIDCITETIRSHCLSYSRVPVACVGRFVGVAVIHSPLLKRLTGRRD